MREVVVDLTGVASRDQFHRELARHFPLAADHAELWQSIWAAFAYRREPWRVRFVGWAGFAARMPRYARRLQQLIGTVRSLPEYGVLVLGGCTPEVEYAVPGTSSGDGSG